MSHTAEQASRRSRKAAPRARSQGTDWLVPLLPLAACFLGGATAKWAEGVVIVLLGILLLLRPPRVSLGRLLNGIILAVLACAALAFLPARWFFEPDWRHALVNDFAVGLGSAVSPQPWISFGCFLSLCAGVSWLYFVATQELENHAVRHQLRLFAGGVGALALLCIALYAAGTALPFWHNQRGFGPFPNRNQTADLLGIASIVILACGQEDIRQNRRRWILWVAAFAAVITAIVLNFSRAGIVILVAGSTVWLGSFAFRRGSAARIAVGCSALLALLTVMLVFGGQTLERFNLRGGGGSVTTDFRWLIFRDTWELIRASPWCGVGLGNFEPVFAIFRDASLGQSKALHPESDWLWFAAEVGWPAMLLVLVGAVLLIRRAFPMGEGTNQRFRLAALIGASLFALHGIVDVSAHRVGSAYAGVFLLGLSFRRPLQLRASRWIPVLFRFVGFSLLVVGAVWSYAASQAVALPGGISVDSLRRAATRANQERNFTETIVHADRALMWAPLDWQLYFLRALGKVGAGGAPAAALEDFRRARFLEPNSFEVPYQEGLAWLTRQPLLAMTAWREALRRAGPQRVELYSRMLSSASGSDRTVNRLLEQYGATQPDLALAFLGRLSAPQFQPALQQLLDQDPTLGALTQEERATFFELWRERGETAKLASFVEAHPEHMDLAWRGVSKQRAAERNFRAAYELAKRFSKPPILPQQAGGVSVEELHRSFYANANNYAVGFALYNEQMRTGDVDEALATVRHLTDHAGAPAYFHFLEAEAWAAKQDWERAWGAFIKFETSTRK